MNDAPRLPLGLKVIIGFHVVSFVLWFFGQAVAVVAYDTVAAWGFQDQRSAIDSVIVEVNRAIGLADAIVMLPLFVVAAIGLLRERFYGAVASWVVFGITLYWPVVAWSSQGFYAGANIPHQPMTWAHIAVPGAAFLIACWGCWYLHRNRERFQ